MSLERLTGAVQQSAVAMQGGTVAVNSLTQGLELFAGKSDAAASGAKRLGSSVGECADAFGRLSNGLIGINGTLATLGTGLIATSNHIRHATQATKEMDPAMKDLIERIAQWNDSLGSGPQTVFIGNLLDDLEQGKIGLAEFMSKAEEVFRGLTGLGTGAFGDMQSQLQQLRNLIAGTGDQMKKEFKEGGEGVKDASKEVENLAHTLNDAASSGFAAATAVAGVADAAGQISAGGIQGAAAGPTMAQRQANLATQAAAAAAYKNQLLLKKRGL